MGSFLHAVVAGIVTLSVSAGCTPTALTRNPTAWEPQLTNAFGSAPIAGQCQWLRAMRANGVALTAEDRDIIEPSMRRNGMTARDIAFAEAGSMTVETGQPYRQVVCMGGILVNDAFYPGIGHQWQMQVGDSYVYLEGDGTESGMRVTGWN